MANGAGNGMQSAQQTIPLDLIVEVVEARYSARQTATTRWWATITISAIAVLVTIASTTVVLLFQNASVDQAKALTRLQEVPVRVPAATPLELPASGSPNVEPSEQVGPEQVAPFSDLTPRSFSSNQLLRDGAAYFTIAVPRGTYVINAEGAGEFDPFISLYRMQGAELHPVASNDDGGEGRNARLVVELMQNTVYQLVVRELLGNPGTVGVSLREQ